MTSSSKYALLAIVAGLSVFVAGAGSLWAAMYLATGQNILDLIPFRVQVSLLQPSPTPMPVAKMPLPTSQPVAATDPTATQTWTPSPTFTRTSTPSPTRTAPPTSTPPSCGSQLEIVDSSGQADLLTSRVVSYIEELGLCDLELLIEIVDGEDVGEEVTGGGDPAGAYSDCFWRNNRGYRMETILAVGSPDYDLWNTYSQGWVTVGRSMYPSALLLHELYHGYQCFITGDVVGEGQWTVDDEYPADEYALANLSRIQAEPLIIF